MRHKIERKKSPQVGEERVVSKFLYIPKFINEEWRWFEKADIKQRVVVLTSLAPECKYPIKYKAWVDIEWVN